MAQDYASRAIARIPQGAITVYTDGASKGNPGPAGSGAYLLFPHSWGAEPIEISLGLGTSTNNIGELCAIGMAAELIIRLSLRHGWPKASIYWLTDSLDSSYSIGVITEGWVQKENRAVGRLVKRLTRDASPDNHFVWVPGHADVDGNDRADQLANDGAEISKHLNPRFFAETIRERIDQGHFFPP